jgi:hypothetical protein
MWDQDTGDADGSTPAQSEAVYTAAVKSNATTMNVLNHETYRMNVLFRVFSYLTSSNDRNDGVNDHILFQLTDFLMSRCFQVRGSSIRNQAATSKRLSGSLKLLVSDSVKFSCR